VVGSWCFVSLTFPYAAVASSGSAAPVGKAAVAARGAGYARRRFARVAAE